MVAGHPRGDPPGQGPALLPPVRENDESEYIAYVSEQNLLADDSGKPLRHPQIKEFFAAREGEVYVARALGMN